EDRQAGGDLAVELEVLVLVAGAQLGAGHVPEIRDLALRAGLKNDVGELFRLDEPAERAEGVLKILPARHGRLADLAGGDLHVLLAQNADDVGGGQVARGELVGVEPDAHAVVAAAEDEDIADAVEAGEAVEELDGGVVAQVQLVEVGLAGARVVV